MQCEKARKKLKTKAFFLAFLLCKKIRRYNMKKENQVLTNFYKKEARKKAKKLIEDGKNMKEIMENVDMNYITEQEILQMAEEILWSDEYQQEQFGVIQISKFNQDNQYVNKSVNQESKTDTTMVLKNTPIGKAEMYRSYLEEFKRNRLLLCTQKSLSNGTVQRYLRLNYLISDLQELVENNKVSLVAAEHLSFIDKFNQQRITHIIKNNNFVISKGIAKRIKEDYRKYQEKGKDYILDLDKLNKYKNEKMINIQFTKEEIDKYFKGIPVKQIKQNMLKLFDENIN